MADGSRPTVAIIGFGLLGASLGMALRGGPYRRTGWTRREEIRRWAVDCDVVDESVADAGAVLRGADLTILAMPVPGSMAFLREHRNAWRPGAVVTDLGSVKMEIMAAAREALTPLGVHFVGGHPMAGTEKSGPYAAFPELYANADVFITPYADSPEPATVMVEELWRGLETRINRIDADRHDDLVAHTSHVLHIVASALASSILGSPEETTRKERFAGCATGFRDTSRIASSNPVMWREIIESNRGAVLTAMADFEKSYFELKRLVETGEFDAFERKFAAGKVLRDRWVYYKNKTKKIN